MSTMFSRGLVRIIDHFDDKPQCLTYMTQLLADSQCLQFPDRFYAAVRGREEIMSTGIGRGVAIPHARDLTVVEMKIAVCLLKEPLEYQALDNQPVKMIFMIAVPQNSNHEYMRILRSLSEYLRQDEKRLRLFESKNEEELFSYVKEIEHVITQNLQS